MQGQLTNPPNILNIELSKQRFARFEMLRAVWYHWHDLKSVKNTHGEVLLLVKLQA